MSRRMTNWIRGAMAGLGATLPMTAFMVVGHRCLPRREQSELPPPKITGRALRSVGALDPAESAGTSLTLAAHLGYGAAAGAVYTGWLERGQPTIVRGVAYGLGVWAGSYLVWLPAVGLHRSAALEPLRRNLLMIGAHVVWGACLTALLSAAAHGQTSDEFDHGECDMTDSPDRYTIIHVTRPHGSETVAAGLTREEAKRWLTRKAKETGNPMSDDLIVPAKGSADETWHAVRAE